MAYRQGSIHWGGGAGGKLPPQTPKLPPQNVVTDHGIQEIFGLNRIKSDLKTSQNQKISWGILPQTPYTMCTSVVSYYIPCTVRRFPPKSTFLDRTLTGSRGSRQQYCCQEHHSQAQVNSWHMLVDGLTFWWLVRRK